MKKNFKKFISILLVILSVMSAMTVGVAAEGEPEADITEDTNGEYNAFYQVFIGFIIEIYEFFKYIFYDVFRGVPVT